MEKIGSYVRSLLESKRAEKQKEVDEIDSFDAPEDYTRRRILEEQINEIDEALGDE